MVNSLWLMVVLLYGLTFPSALTSTSDSNDDPNIATQTLVTDEALARNFLETFDRDIAPVCHNRALKEWIRESDITEAHRVDATNATIAYLKLWKRKWRESQKYDWQMFEDRVLKRQFKLLSTLGVPVLSPEKLKKYNSLRQKLGGIFSTAKICKPSDMEKCDLSLEPEITELMMYSRNESELRSAWIQWRDATGKKMRADYAELAKIMKEVAVANNISDVFAYETRSYESPSFLADVEELWAQLHPFYLQLHAYVRRKLGEKYGIEIVPPLEPIPSHLLGNMWAMSWPNIFDLVTPYNTTKSIDATPVMLASNFTPKKMAEIAEDFYVSMGFPPLPQQFWEGSIFEKQPDKEMNCHASSWDLCDRKNFWIKQCTRINMEDLITLHHEIGLYKDQPKIFREGANPGFHEAVGDLIALSVQTPEHLHKIGLLDGIETNYESDINHLLLMALEKIAFLPYGLLIDKWRWGVFDGKIHPAEYNCEWWNLRVKYQGLSPPVARSVDDFDPGAKYHVAANIGYIRYFVSTIIQFQFHEALCKIASQYDPSHPESRPLHKCDLYGSKEAGDILRSALRLGSSEPWPYAMQILTRQSKMDAKPILDYFRPLIEWLELDNKKHNVAVGWKEGEHSCQTKHSSSIGIFQSSPILLLFTKLITYIQYVFNF